MLHRDRASSSLAAVWIYALQLAGARGDLGHRQARLLLDADRQLHQRGGGFANHLE